MKMTENLPLIISISHLVIGILLSILNHFIQKESEMIDNIKMLKLNEIQSVSKMLEEIMNSAMEIGSASTDESGSDQKVSYTFEMIRISKQCYRYDRINFLYNLLHNLILYSIFSGIALTIISFFGLLTNLIVILAVVLIGIQLISFFVLRYFTSHINKLKYNENQI